MDLPQASICKKLEEGRVSKNLGVLGKSWKSSIWKSPELPGNNTQGWFLGFFPRDFQDLPFLHKTLAKLKFQI